ncbi:MAG: hypothetical protein ACI4C3_04285 [Bacteroides sp.]
MSYTDNANITNAEGACTFFRHLIMECNVNLHPDDDFSDSTDKPTGQTIFTPEEAKLYNRLMDESFTACEREGKDIYEIGLQEMQSYLSA